MPKEVERGTVEVRVLGPIELWHGEREVRLQRRQQRLMLAILALEANRFVSSDYMIDLVWGAQPPASARAMLQTRMSELRARLDSHDADVGLSSRGAGYLLEIPPQNVDGHLFRELVAQVADLPSDAEKRATLRAALKLWRGPVLGEVVPGGPVAALCEGLEAARRTALEDLLAVELRLGNHHQVADEALGACRESPTRERLVGLSMLALHRSSRSAEALQVYDRVRRWLGQELGTDPSPDLQAVYEAILRNDASSTLEQAAGHPDGGDSATWGGPPPAWAEAGELFDAPVRPVDEQDAFQAPVPRTLPPDIADFSGRSRQIEVLREALGNRAGQVPIDVVTGPGGAGKTALSVHVAHTLQSEFPDGQLYANLRGADEHAPADPAEILGRFLRALGVDGLVIPDGLEDRADLYRSVMAERQILVLLDNAATDGQVFPLLPSSPTSAVIVNSRARLGATFGARTLDLDALDHDEAISLFAAVAGKARVTTEPDAVARLLHLCGHLPLAIRIVGAKLAARRHWTVQKLISLLDDERGSLDHFTHGHLDVRASIALSYSGLAPQAQRLLCRLGDMSLPSVTLRMCAALLDTSDVAAEEVMEHLVEAHLVDVDGFEGDRLPQYHLHDLIRRFAQERAGVDDEDGALREARVRAYGAQLVGAESAYRALFGGSYLTMHSAAPRWTPARPGGSADSSLDPMQWFEDERAALIAMVHRAALDGCVEVSWDLACTASIFFAMRRIYDDWHDILRTALAAAAGAQDERGQAAVLYYLGLWFTDRQEPQRAWESFDRAATLFARAGDRHGYGVVTAYKAMIDRFARRYDAALQGYQAALAELSDTADFGGEAHALRGIGQVHMATGDYDAAEDHFERAMAVYRGIGAEGSRIGRAQVLLWQGMLHKERGQFERAEALFNDVLGITEATDDPHGQAHALRGLAIVYAHRGDFDRADVAGAAALSRVRSPVPTIMEADVRRTLAEISLLREDRSSATAKD